MVENMKYEVCVRCMTFNQAKYITETMNGFVIQKTNFPFVCCIIDDASTDGEQEVIMKYVYENFVIIETSCHETEYAKIYYAQLLTATAHKADNLNHIAILHNGCIIISFR